MSDIQTEVDKTQDITLLDILDSVIDKGVIIKGDLMISIANINLIYIELRLLVSAVQTAITNNILHKNI